MMPPDATDDPFRSSFGAVFDQRTRVVIFGSLPGDTSLQHRQYYARPTNQFWRLTGALIGRDLASEPYENRLALLLEAGIGLWDVIGKARRKGSSDSAIRDWQANDLLTLANSLPDIRALAFNGGKSFALGRKQFGEAPLVPLIALPSSSAAYCSITFEQKREIWLRLREYL